MSLYPEARMNLALPREIPEAFPTDGASHVRCFSGTGRQPKKSLARGATGKAFRNRKFADKVLENAHDGDLV